jgi:hypothetical protein
MNRSATMQTTSNENQGAEANPTSIGQRAEDHHRDGAAGTATELGRHYGEHGHSSNAGAGPSAHESSMRSAMASGTEAARDIANRAREQAGPAARAVYDQGARAGEYVARNVHEYPATALLVAAAVGYGLAYLLHAGGSRREVHNRYDQGAH